MAGVYTVEVEIDRERVPGVYDVEVEIERERIPRVYDVEVERDGEQLLGAGYRVHRVHKYPVKD